MGTQSLESTADGVGAGPRERGHDILNRGFGFRAALSLAFADISPITGNVIADVLDHCQVAISGEVVQSSDDIPLLHASTAGKNLFVVARKRSRDVALEIDDGSALLRIVSMMSDRFNLACQLSMMNSRREHTLATIGDAFSQHRFTPSEFRANGDLAQTFSFTREQARRVVLINHDQRDTEPACRLGDQSERLGQRRLRAKSIEARTGLPDQVESGSPVVSDLIRVVSQRL